MRKNTPENDWQELTAMVADYMEKGFLENIVDMFKHDPALYALIPALMTDERLRVRIGTSALLETLHEEDRDNAAAAVPHLVALLAHEDANVRGDAAYLLGLVGGPEHAGALAVLLQDGNRDVRTIAEEAIVEMRKKKGEG